MLTPEEFVAAGDHLVHHCPTWQWAVGDEAKIKPYLPSGKNRIQTPCRNHTLNRLQTRVHADKQFLITRNVACHRRCKQMEYVGEETLVETADGDDEGWVETHHYGTDNDGGQMAELEENVCEMTLDTAKVCHSVRIFETHTC